MMLIDQTIPVQSIRNILIILFLYIINYLVCISLSFVGYVGHHPGLVNPYLSKVYENIIRLQYKTVFNDTVSAYHVLGVVSKMEEILDFPEVINTTRNQI